MPQKTRPINRTRNCRYYANGNPTTTENINVGHSGFLAEASPTAKWRGEGKGVSNGGLENGTDFDNVTEGKGKLSPTSSHLFKLILPLGHLSLPTNTRSEPYPKNDNVKSPPPTVILLHPSQPLSHVSRLILGSLAPATPKVSFRSTSSRGQVFQWSDSTDVGDFIRDAARAAKFSISISYELSPQPHPSDTPHKRVVMGENDGAATEDAIIEVEVPTFADRTRFLRRRLADIERELHAMEGLKQECDKEAHRGAKRMAVGGFGMLVAYWGTVARLTFWDYGWDVMEPITYLSGLSTVICGYLWFLYQGREVSYSSVLDRSISARREALYKSRGLDIEQWIDLKSDARSLRREISRIAEDYDEKQLMEEKSDERGEERRSKKDSKVEKAEHDCKAKTPRQQAAAVGDTRSGGRRDG